MADEGSVTIAEAAALLAVSVDTIRKAVRVGELPAQRLGRTVRIPRSAVMVKAVTDTDGYRDVRADLATLSAQIERYGNQIDEIQKSLAAVHAKAVTL
ncbi:MAG TPA: excisionase family DNA-binding protein [Actinocrinis sp.]|uniref:excisionase family DNA-binding protein n=1 Tax=Actinocrinis sp. TaxID=1920516 RepID=UPI002DDCEA0F|nr:excisionase family DNA-binding protein [Actinocrinis sp.]HEV2347393.1 excisionase family DNA-binding protein [Actinocrinis sp.]